VSDNPKTDAQRRSLHLWFEKVAKVFNDNGIEKSVVIELLTTRGLDTQWTKESFKEDVFKPVYNKVTGGKVSTEEANTKDFDICVTGLQKWAAEVLEVTLPPFPDRFSQAESQA
jgi:hypothetical protein